MTSPPSLDSDPLFLGDIRTCCPDVCARVHQEIFGQSGWSAKSFADLFQLTTTFGHGFFSPHDLHGFYVAQGVLDTGEILTFGVQAKSQHKGYGGRLMERLITSCRTHNIGSLFLEVRASNLIAQEFYLKRGFSIKGRRTGYYSSAEEGSVDALTMGLTLELTGGSNGGHPK